MYGGGREGGGRVQIVSSYYAAVCMALDNKHGPLKPITFHNQVTWHVIYCCHGTYHLPDLQYVVLRDAAQHPGFIGVPGKIWNFSCMAPVDKLEREDKQTLLKEANGGQDCLILCHSLSANATINSNHPASVSITRHNAFSQLRLTGTSACWLQLYK